MRSKKLEAEVLSDVEAKDWWDQGVCSSRQHHDDGCGGDDDDNDDDDNDDNEDDDEKVGVDKV